MSGDDQAKREPTEQETARRRDEALRRALKMPPKPHKPAEKGESDAGKVE